LSNKGLRSLGRLDEKLLHCLEEAGGIGRPVSMALHANKLLRLVRRCEEALALGEGYHAVGGAVGDEDAVAAAADLGKVVPLVAHQPAGRQPGVDLPRHVQQR